MRFVFLSSIYLKEYSAQHIMITKEASSHVDDYSVQKYSPVHEFLGLTLVVLVLTALSMLTWTGLVDSWTYPLSQSGSWTRCSLPSCCWWADFLMDLTSLQSQTCSWTRCSKPECLDGLIDPKLHKLFSNTTLVSSTDFLSDSIKDLAFFSPQSQLLKVKKFYKSNYD